MRLFDVMLAALVILPLLAAGLSFQRPGGDSVEVADLGIPILAVALVAAAVRASSRVDWRGAAALAVRQQSARTLWYAAAALAGVFLALWLWRLWESHNPGFGVTSAIWSLTHGAGAVVTLVVYGAAVRHWLGEPWEKSLFVRLGERLAQAWLRALGRSAPRALWSAAAIVGAGFLWVALIRHRAFESHGHDLGLFTNAIWNLTQGNGYVSSVKGGINLFADHQSPLFWALAPLFRLAPFPETLLAAQAFGLAAGGPALFYLARACFGQHWAGAALPWLYWSYLPLRNANAFDFHPEVFMLPLFLWAFVGLYSERRWAKALGVLALVGALGAKESAPVVGTGIGIAWALSGRKAWPGLALAAASIAVFFFDVKVVPRFFGDDYAYLNLYGRFGGSITDLLLAPLTQPGYFFSQLLDRERLIFLFWTLAPLGFLPLFDWRSALAILPPYLMLFLSEGDQRVRIIFHYGIEPGSVLFWGLPLGLAAFVRRFGWRRAGVWMLAWSTAAHGPGEIARAHGHSYIRHAPWLAEAMPCLHAAAPMAASGALVPHLASRDWISYPDQLEQQPSGERVHCVVIDRKVDNWPVAAALDQVLAGLPEQGYREVYRCHDFRVFELGAAGCLRCRPRCY